MPFSLAYFFLPCLHHVPAATQNKWADRANFVKHDEQYQLVETAEDDDGAVGEDAALGKLSVAQIEKGQACLAQIKALLAGGAAQNAAAINHASGQFYSLIPTKSGRKAPEPLNNPEIVQFKEALLEFWLRCDSFLFCSCLHSPVAFCH